MGVSAIIPAYNEADRIGAVLGPVRASEVTDDIVVVDDGSEDDTGEVARGWGARVLRLAANQGKAAALDRGVGAARHDTLLFLDADLVGLRAEHVARLVRAYEQRRPDMVVGIFRSGRINTDLSQTLNPHLSGQRVLSRGHWDRLIARGSLDYGVEMALTKLALKEDWQEIHVDLEGVTHVMKEEKRGLSQGFRERLTMYGDILRSLFSRAG